MSQLSTALSGGLVSTMIGCGVGPGVANGPDGGAGGREEGGTGTGSVSGGVDTRPNGAPVRVTRGDPVGTFVACNFEARGWPAEDESRSVILRLGHPDRLPERLVAAEARVERGAFRIAVPMGCEKGLYKRKALMVDVDGDGACTRGVDRIYTNSSFLVGDLTFVLAGSVPDGNMGGGERRLTLGSAETVAEACDVFNLPWPER